MSAGAGLGLDRRGQRRRDAAAAVGLAYLDVLHLGRIGQREVGVADRLGSVPGDQIEAGPGMQARKAEDGSDDVGLAVCERPDLPFTHGVTVDRVRIRSLHTALAF